MKPTFTRTLRCLALLALLTVLALPALAAKPGLSLMVQPSTITVGETAQLTITVTGGSGDEPALTPVDGLEFTPIGQSSSYQSINGVVTASSSHTYLVTAARAGHFTIPALKIGHGSLAATTQPVVLQVVAGTGSATGAHTHQPPAAALPSPNVPSADNDQAVSADGQQAFLRLVTPKHKWYVGELVPVQIKAFFRGGVQATLNGLPALNSNAFTLNALDDKPTQAQEELEGQPYIVLTWTTALTAVKAGDYALSLELPVLLKVREKARRSRGLFGDAFFDDSLFDNFFGGGVEKQVTLTSEEDTVNVHPLPTANRPADFGGALGQFTVSAEALPDHVTTGDPITLRMKVIGRGNFDRISSGLLNTSADWKTYKPVARFAPADSVGSEGTKTFEQAVVPLQAGHLQIPPLSFSFFEPATAKYVTHTTLPIAIEVAPAAAGRVTVAPIANPSAVAPPGNAARPEFGPNRIEQGHFIPTLRPLFLQPWFLLANGLTWIGLAAACYAMRRRTRRVRDPLLSRAREVARAIHAQLAAMDLAVQRAETAAFFNAARRALQQRLGARWGLPPETITLSEINVRLNGEADTIRVVFQMADQEAYSHESLPADDLAGWRRIVTEQLKQLETP